MEGTSADQTENQGVAEKFMHLVGIMDQLREQCPWDREQTIDTLRSMTIEETYELADAIDQTSWPDIKEELGDLLLHLLFYTRIATEKKVFTLAEVLDGISKKMVRRHPHIYGDVIVNDAADVKKNWQKIKLQEGKTSIFSGVPVALPAVVKATRIQEKARQVGFEWEQSEQVYAKVKEEMSELEAAVATHETADIEEEFGDLMFSLINYARFLNIDAETALEKCNRKFIRRFQLMEKLASDDQRPLNTLDLEGMDAYWDKAKAQLKAVQQGEQSQKG